LLKHRAPAGDVAIARNGARGLRSAKRPSTKNQKGSPNGPDSGRISWSEPGDTVDNEKEAFMKVFGIRLAKIIGSLFLGFLVIGFLSVCKSQKSEELKPVAEQEVYTMDTLQPIFGVAAEDHSGILDVTGDANTLVISYRYYDDDQKNYDDDMVKELAPKIDAMYKKFKGLDHVVFNLTTNDPLSPGTWKEYMSFGLRRKVVEEVGWSGILTDDFFKRVIDLHRM
jgi:hypothetical protein